MITKELIEIIENEKNVLGDYFDLTEDKQDALVHRNREQLENIIRLESELILKIKRVETQRLNEIKKIYGSREVNNEDYKLSSLVIFFGEKIDTKMRSYLLKSEQIIKDLVKGITDTNRTNVFLIKHSIKFIDDTITAILGIKKRNIVDRKV